MTAILSRVAGNIKNKIKRRSSSTEKITDRRLAVSLTVVLLSGRTPSVPGDTAVYNAPAHLPAVSRLAPGTHNNI